MLVQKINAKEPKKLKATKPTRRLAMPLPVPTGKGLLRPEFLTSRRRHVRRLTFLHTKVGMEVLTREGEQVMVARVGPGGRYLSVREPLERADITGSTQIPVVDHAEPEQTVPVGRPRKPKPSRRARRRHCHRM